MTGRFADSAKKGRMSSLKAVFYGHGGVENRGCEAIVRSTGALLREVCPGAELSLCSVRHVSDRQARLPGIHRVVPHKMQPYSRDRLLHALTRRMGASPEALAEREQGAGIRWMKRADIALSIGGDTYCYHPPKDLFAIDRALLRAGKPFVLWACSIDPERLEGELLADLRSFSRIYARESITREALKEKGIEARFCCDPAFTLEAEQVALPESFLSGRTVGLNLSPLSLTHAVDAEGVLSGAVALVRHVLAHSEDAVALIPHVRWDHDDDMEPLRRVKAAFPEEKRVLLLGGDYTAPQLKGMISQLRCLVTARTHASIAAYSTGVPALVLGYSVKARGIARDLLPGVEGTLLPVQALSKPGQLLEGYEALLASVEIQRKMLAERLPEYTESVREAARDVASLAGWKA